VLAAPGRAAALVELPVDPPLGVGRPHVPRRTTTVALPPGGVLVCYTDGLVERRHEVIDEGIGRLTALVEPLPAETVCTTVMTGIGVDHPTDDVALLVLRRL
jgi:serine phosphatase RsbU (regulator of sigma subunit)